FYRENLKDIEGFEFIPEPDRFYSNRWLSTVLINEDLTGIGAKNIREGLEEYNIETRPLWKPMHIQPIFKKEPYYGEKVAENLFNTGLCLTSGTNLTEEDLNRVTSRIKKVVTG